MLSACPASEDRYSPAVYVVVIVDQSASFAPLKAVDHRALRVVSDALMRLAIKDWPHPVAFYWAMIGSSGLHATEPCGSPISFRRSLLSKRQSGSERTRDAELRGWFDACLELLKSGKIPPEKCTDIRGALKRASEAAAVATRHRVIVVLSDFSEDLCPGDSPLELQLNSEDIIMLHRPDPGDQRDPNRTMEKINRWRSELESRGAFVCTKAIYGLVEGAITQCVREIRADG